MELLLTTERSHGKCVFEQGIEWACILGNATITPIVQIARELPLELETERFNPNAEEVVKCFAIGYHQAMVAKETGKARNFDSYPTVCHNCSSQNQCYQDQGEAKPAGRYLKNPLPQEPTTPKKE